MTALKAIAEKVTLSLLASLIVAIIKEIAALYVVLPDLYIAAGQRVLLGPPYLSFLVSVLIIYTLISSSVSGFVIWNGKLGRICPQMKFLSHIGEFASNGFASYEYIQKGGIHSMRITLVNENAAEDSEAYTTFGDCGIIFYKSLRRFYMSRSAIHLTHGLKVSDKTMLRMEILGQDGGEQIGLGMKDTDGNEQKRTFSRLLPAGIERDTWREVNIDLESHYNRVIRTMDISKPKYLENFSIFTNTHLARGKKIVVYVRNIRFE